ncbi:MbnH family di-heme enzyme [Alkalinema pantanalense CENA528]|uniref:MbnH family di-heme enzyme n=1 Tax=Alkalinema pantanalense TaxID=1620705 RepID=UPI003D6FF76D
MALKGKRKFAWMIALTLSFLLAIGLSKALAASSPSSTYEWNLPANLPKPIVPADNPITPEKVELGRHLFYEKRLSITGKYSCASCHEQKRAFTDGKPVGIGATGEKHPRNSMSLANIAYNSVLTWANPLMTRLETQALVPMFGEHPVELGMVGREDQILSMLNQDLTYQKLFAAAFGNNKREINLSNLTKALASFERSLISFNSPYDRYRFSGDKNAISASAKRGEKLFHSERLECFHCHGGFNFSDSVKHERLAFTEIAFHNTGLYNIDDNGAFPPNNTGVYEITQKPTDMGRFKAPTLRNIALTAPYMHDGSIATLEEVIDHYRVGGRTIHAGEYAGIGSKNPFKSHFISGFEITSTEKQDLLAFLHSLTDEVFIHNSALSNPNEN